MGRAALVFKPLVQLFNLAALPVGVSGGCRSIGLFSISHIDSSRGYARAPTNKNFQVRSVITGWMQRRALAG